jgi:aryl-alcohol dehydrogenase-like predicted oxidoreductase
MLFGGATNETESVSIVHKAMNKGVNFIDCADVYTGGEAERIVGKAIRGVRDNVVLATKGRQRTGQGINDAGASRLHLMRAVDASLKRLGTDYVDIYYVHAPDRSTAIDETMRALDDMVRSGRIRYVGCSNFRAWQVCEALWASDKLKCCKIVCVQPLYNVVNRDAEVELLPLCDAHKLAVVSYSPLARSVLTGKYKTPGDFPEGSRAARGDKRLAQAELRSASIEISQQIAQHCARKGCTTTQFALAWVLANTLITSVIIGPRTIEQLEDNLSCFDVEITESDETFIDSLVPAGEHSGKGFVDPLYPVEGRKLRSDRSRQL